MSSLDFLERLLDGVAVEWTVLGDERFVEVANTARRPVKASLRLSGVTPYYGANNIQDYVDGYTHDGEYVLIAEDGSASLENYSVQFATGKFWANNHVHVVRGKNKLSTRFLYHYLQTVDFMPYLPNKDRSKLTKGEMIKIPLPVPCPEDTEKSLKIQFEIVRILDAFTAMTAELTAELTARKKQYNYYRDQLLSFEEGVPLLPLSQCCESIADGDHQAPQKLKLEFHLLLSLTYQQRIRLTSAIRSLSQLHTTLGSIANEKHERMTSFTQWLVHMAFLFISIATRILHFSGTLRFYDRIHPS